MTGSEEDATVRVVVADDQRVVREGLVTSLSVMPGVKVVGAAADGEQAVALVARYRPQVVLMDLRMPRLDGVEATRRILADYPATAVVVLTTYADDDSILAALRVGALGYLTKDAGREQIARALHAAAGGQAILDPAIQARLVTAAGPALDAAPTRPLPDGLTCARGRGPVPHRDRAHQRPDRRRPRRQPIDREDPHQQHLRQDWRHQPGPGRPLCPHPRVRRPGRIMSTRMPSHTTRSSPSAHTATGHSTGRA